MSMFKNQFKNGCHIGVKKQDPTKYCLKAPPVTYEDIDIQTYHESINQKKMREAIFLSDIVGFRTSDIMKE